MAAPSRFLATLTTTLLLLTLTTSAPAGFAPPATTDAYTVIGLEKVEIRDRALVGEGGVALTETTGRLALHRFISLGDGTALVADAPAIGEGTSVFDLFANDLALVDPGATVRGLTTSFVPPVLALPPLPAFAPGVDPVTVERDETQVLAPGAYGDVYVNRRGTLILPGGAYELASLRTNKLSKVFVEGPATINVAGRLYIGHLAGFGASVTGLTPDQVQVNVGGRSVKFGPATHVAADVLAPLARMRLGRSFHGRGTFIGRQVLGDQTLNLRLGLPSAMNTETAGGPRPVALHCTTTQADYGDAASAVNAPGGALEMHPEVFPLTVGMPGVAALTIADQASLICLLPATGLDAALCTGLASCGGDMTIDACTSPPILDFDGSGDGSSGGQGAGTLLGELVAAKLNVALSPGLGELVIPEMLCTTACPDGRELDPSKMGQQAAAAGIADGINTVADLLAIADQALGSPCTGRTCATTRQAAFAPPNPIARSSITTALQVLSECFAGCADVVPCP